MSGEHCTCATGYALEPRILATAHGHVEVSMCVPCWTINDLAGSRKPYHHDPGDEDRSER